MGGQGRDYQLSNYYWGSVFTDGKKTLGTKLPCNATHYIFAKDKQTDSLRGCLNFRTQDWEKAALGACCVLDSQGLWASHTTHKQIRKELKTGYKEEWNGM